MVFPLLIVSIAQDSLGLRDSNVAPSGMEIEVYGIFATHILFVSLTTGVGIAIFAAQAGAKGKADATDSVPCGDDIAGARVGAISSVGTSLGVAVNTTASVGVACGGVNN